ncbi:transporter substrate-binding domain-containing protein [Bradyrhizobium sp.]|jgi:polar amino acid transport system substrate-binding protein|uniref:transporter substrate-binding domain-containing protein n=1 Tax=Bradyrhizobium sp. TaxID=376 RepID=UPI002DDCCE19|nr:transporter substrate-binding domain-containing protein [Bradyrhizobium sp.]HEV2157348.1 transporter substrate-binding domain-containing protein [Bradyrhizobium sp.]
MWVSRRVFSIGLAAILSVIAAVEASGQTALDGIVRSKAVRIAVPTDFPPYGFVGSDMQPQGLDIDMARLIAGKLGATVELIPVTTSNRIPYLQTRKADLVISTLGKNPDREKVIDFTAAYSPFFIGVFAPKAMELKAPEALAGKSIAVTRGSVDDSELTKVAPSTAEIRRFEDNNATISAFVAGQTQTVATSAQVAAAMITKNPQLGAEYKFLLKDSPNFIGVGKGEDALRAKLNEIILAAKADGTLEALSRKWLGRSTGDLPE